MTQAPDTDAKARLNGYDVLEPSSKLDLSSDFGCLFSLSQVSRHWRPLCQELLWDWLRLHSVRSISRLQELCGLAASTTALGATPSPLCFVGELSFAWQCNPRDMAHDDLSVPERYGKPLELAFRDRAFVLQEEHAEEQRDGIEQAIYHGLLDEPWRQHAQPLEDEERLASLGSGPDWRGAEVIKSAEELEEALVEVVAFTALNGKLKCFMWESSVLPMPAEVSRLLASCPSMRTLGFSLDIPTFRDGHFGTREWSYILNLS